jgi:arylsulfatase A-like enzyme
MKKSHFRLFVAVVLAIAAPSAAASANPGDERRPNILFIMSDDHATQAVGVYGGRLAGLNPTPTIDSLARNGMRFDRVFANNSICTPSRASIITGQYPQRNGVFDLDGEIGPEKQFLPQELRKAGYQTAVIGKWHLKREPAAFDYYYVLPGQGSYYDPTFLQRGPKPWPENSVQKPGEHSSDAITDASLDWLKRGRDKTRPFFLMHQFKAPHDMFVNARRYDSYLEDVDIPKPPNLLNPPAGSPGSSGLGSGIGRVRAPWGLGKRLGVSDELDETAYVEATYQRFLKRYLRCVKGIDDNIKRLIDHLRETGELDNTVIIYTTDQGYLLGEHDLMDKRWMYEESIRMPFIVHWPAGVEKGRVNDWMIDNTDFAPTLLSLAGVRTPSYMQGRSFAEALKGKPCPADWRQAIYYRYWMHMAHALAVPAHFGLRSERYKLIFFYGLDRTNAENRPTPAAWEFYDLAKDPGEMENLYGNPAYQGMIASMKTQLMETRKQLGETDESHPAIQRVIDAHWPASLESKRGNVKGKS